MHCPSSSDQKLSRAGHVLSHLGPGELRAGGFYTGCMSKEPQKFRKPARIEQWFNWLFGALVGAGIGPSYAYQLQVTGRKSGKTYSTPVNIVERNGKRLLVAPRGETQWVRNARAIGQVSLKRGRTLERFRQRELADSEKPEILKQYLDSYRFAVQRYFPIRAGSPVDAFLGIASRYPVFELIPDGQYSR
jgi:deazaflavin-dependent oxidoreductase (nitroreductase family)